MSNMPHELSNHNQGEYDVNVVIGENASGKSVLLNDIAHSYTNERKTVIAVATSIHDKFNNRSKFFNFYGGRQGRCGASKVVKNALMQKYNDEIDRVESLIKVLEYVKYETRIGVKILGFNQEKIISVKRSEFVVEEEKYDIISLLEKYHDVFQEENIVSIELKAFTRGHIQGAALSSILKYEKLLRKHNVIKSLSLYLVKNNQDIPLQDASSGELMIISTLMFIASNIVNDAVILIDEPENSLHPRWQREYIKNILDLFYYHRPKIVIATHSSLIIPLKNDLTNLFVIKEHQIQKRSSTSNNNEELLSEDFGIVTPENRYLSDQMIELLNMYSAGKLTYNEIVLKIKSYKAMVYDTVQENFLEGVLNIVEKIKSKGIAG